MDISKKKLRLIHITTNRKTFAALWAATMLSPVLGCATSEVSRAQAPSTNQALIARPCAALVQRGVANAPVAMYIEVASVLSPVEPSLREAVAKPVHVDQVAGILVSAGETVSAPWSACADELCTAKRDGMLRVAFTSLPAGSSAPVQLQFRLDEGAEVTVDAHDQAPAQAQPAHLNAEHPLIVTPYYLYPPQDESLRLLYQCKAQRTST